MFLRANYLILHMEQTSNDPLHGKTLEFIVTELVNYFGWEDLGQHIPINCFTSSVTINSSVLPCKGSLEACCICNIK